MLVAKVGASVSYRCISSYVNFMHAYVVTVKSV